MAARILLVEDDRRLAPLVERYLADHGFEVAWAADGEAGWREVVAFAPDLVVLDLMLPGRDGLDLLRQIRAETTAAVVMLTARGDEADRVVGLELGADDYLTKPFSLRELLARVRAVLRRTRPDGEKSPPAPLSERGGPEEGELPSGPPLPERAVRGDFPGSGGPEKGELPSDPPLHGRGVRGDFPGPGKERLAALPSGPPLFPKGGSGGISRRRPEDIPPDPPSGRRGGSEKAQRAGVTTDATWSAQRTIGPFVLDLERRTLHRDGEPIELTRSEFDVLELLTRRPGRVLRRAELLTAVRGGATEAYDRAVDTHVSNLRRKLERDPRRPEHVVTVWGVGYRWATE